MLQVATTGHTGASGPTVMTLAWSLVDAANPTRMLLQEMGSWRFSAIGASIAGPVCGHHVIGRCLNRTRSGGRGDADLYSGRALLGRPTPLVKRVGRRQVVVPERHVDAAKRDHAAARDD